MPIYTYKCNKCSNQADYIVKFNDPVPACKSCDSTEQEKQLSSGTGFCLMGHGWHRPGMSAARSNGGN